TCEAATKFVPVTVSVKAGPPAVALLGASVDSVGAGALTVNVRATDVPPPGAGVTTVTEAVPGAARSAAEMAAANWVLLTNVVVRAAPFQRTVEAGTKPLPVTVNVNAAPPTVALLGASVVSTGVGLGFATVTVTGALVIAFPARSTAWAVSVCTAFVVV